MKGYGKHMGMPKKGNKSGGVFSDTSKPPMNRKMPKQSKK